MSNVQEKISKNIEYNLIFKNESQEWRKIGAGLHFH